jgi:hypothetical protein
VANHSVEDLAKNRIFIFEFYGSFGYHHLIFVGRCSVLRFLRSTLQTRSMKFLLVEEITIIDTVIFINSNNRIVNVIGLEEPMEVY